MVVTVRVISRAKKNEVKEISPGNFKVYVTKPPLKNEANEATLEILANHFGIKKTNLRIIKGFHSPNKLIELFN